MNVVATTLVVEFNCYVSGKKVTIWLVPRPILPEERDHLPDIPDIIRCIGPVEQKVGFQVKDSIVKFLEATGVPVKVEAIADD